MASYLDKTVIDYINPLLSNSYVFAIAKDCKNVQKMGSNSNLDSLFWLDEPVPVIPQKVT